MEDGMILRDSNLNVPLVDVEQSLITQTGNLNAFDKLA
jgi:hypothetical protein